ncbi:hypothetical protein HD806DRAFT_539853 [Xylariaceae sp. AK1471]|nr:hypothetical protein HD806DRAFT_539853 [Xylariaceae sp. AK1471]
MATFRPEPLQQSDPKPRRIDTPDPYATTEQRPPRRRQSSHIFVVSKPSGGHGSRGAESGRQKSFGPLFPQSPPSLPAAYTATQEFPSPNIRYSNVPPMSPSYYGPAPSGTYNIPSSTTYITRRRPTWEDGRDRKDLRRREEELLSYEIDRARRQQRSHSPRRSRRHNFRTSAASQGRYSNEENEYDSETPSSDESTESSATDGGLNATQFTFKPSRVLRSATTEDGEYSDEEHSPGQAIAEPAAGLRESHNVLRIYQSQYTGDAFVEGTHNIMMTGFPSGPGNNADPARLTTNHSRSEKEPLFRWLINWLNQSERNGLIKLLAEVKKNCVKTKQNSDGKHFKYMEPRFIQVSMKPEPSSTSFSQKQLRTVSWLSIPYFSLKKFSGPLSATDATNFPPLTLLQAQYSRSQPQRDMEQVVCQLHEEHASAKSFFHIAQLWCIVVDTTITIVPPALPLSNSEGDNGQERIYVSYGEAILWSFPLNKCRTWLEFLSHFYGFWPEPIQFSHRDRVLSADDWDRIYNLARYSSYKIMLILKITPRPFPPPKGILKSIDPDEPDASEELEGHQHGRQVLSQNNPPGLVRDRGSTSQPRQEEIFHVFSWLDTAPNFTVENHENHATSNALSRALADIERYLLAETKPTDKIAYRVSPEANRRSLFDYLREQGMRVEEKSAENRKRRQQYEQRVDILNAADTVFQFFLPVGADGPTATKYWGAIQSLIKMPPHVKIKDSDDDEEDIEASAARAHVPSVRLRLRNMAKEYQHAQNLMSQVQLSDRAKVAIPDGLILAWIHTTMGLIYAMQDSQVWEEHLDKATGLVSAGLHEITNRLAGYGNLLGNAVILPMEIVSIVGFKLLQDATNGAPNISETYSEYLKAIAADITTKPSDRSMQHRISLLKQELAIIENTVAAQRRIFTAIITSLLKSQSSPAKEVRAIRTYSPSMHMSSNPIATSEYGEKVASVATEATYVSSPPEEHMSRPPPPYERRGGYGHDENRHLNHDRSGASHYHRSHMVESSLLDPDESYKLSPTYPGGFRYLLAGDCAAFLEKRLRDFEEYDFQASVLEETNANKIDTTKDHQERAIYAFTVVTIIFLPLSAIAGIFGMNTADIRDTNLNQWVYWATAVPVTIVIIVLGLWWMGELGNALAWILKRLSRDRGGVSPSYAGWPPQPPGYQPNPFFVPPPPPPPPPPMQPFPISRQRPFQNDY